MTERFQALSRESLGRELGTHFTLKSLWRVVASHEINENPLIRCASFVVC